MSKQTRSAKLLRIACAGVCVMVAAAAWCSYSGGYWENVPVLDRLSGPMRFREFVADPIPSSIRDLRGGYSGFPQGRIRTVFAYSEEPQSLLAEWNPVHDPATKQEIEAARFSYTKAFQKNGGAFLLIDEKERRGCLYVP